MEILKDAIKLVLSRLFLCILWTLVVPVAILFGSVIVTIWGYRAAWEIPNEWPNEDYTGHLH